MRIYDHKIASMWRLAKSDFKDVFFRLFFLFGSLFDQKIRLFYFPFIFTTSVPKHHSPSFPECLFTPSSTLLSPSSICYVPRKSFYSFASLIASFISPLTFSMNNTTYISRCSKTISSSLTPSHCWLKIRLNAVFRWMTDPT